MHSKCVIDSCVKAISHSFTLKCHFPSSLRHFVVFKAEDVDSVMNVTFQRESVKSLSAPVVHTELRHNIVL
jgi:hypothetical protein